MMLDYESTIGKADTKGISARVIIPKEIMKILNLDYGDKLIWFVDVKDEGFTIRVEKKEN